MSQARKRWVGGVVGGLVLVMAGVTFANADPPAPTDQVVAQSLQHAPHHRGQQAKDIKVRVGSDKTGVITLAPGADVTVQGEDAPNTVTKAQPDGVQVLTVIRQGNKAGFKLNLPRGLNLVQNGNGYDLTADGPEGAVTLLSVDAPWAIDAAGKSLPTSYSLLGKRLIQTVDTKDAVYPITADPYFARKWYGAQVQFTWNETRFMAAGAGAVAVVAAAIPDATLSKIVAIGAGAVAWWAGTATLYNKCIALNVWWTGTLQPWYWGCPH